jgi:soluble P-type ATPase
MRPIDIPGRPPLELEYLLLDVNGTLTNRGELIEGVAARLRNLRETLEVHLLSADTFGSLQRVVSLLGTPATIVRDGADKAAVVRDLGPSRCAAIGNGANDAAMVAAAALGIVVIGPEGAATSALLTSNIVCRSIVEAFELLQDEQAIAATLRP